MLLEDEMLNKDMAVHYELGVGPGGTNLAIRVRGDVMRFANSFMRDPKHSPTKDARITLPHFIFPAGVGWGFGRSLRSLETGHPDWVGWEAPLSFGYFTDENERLAASLEVLFNALDFAGDLEDDKNASALQLMHVNVLGKATGEYSIGGTIGGQMVRWLRTHRVSSQLHEVVDVMKKSYFFVQGEPVKTEFDAMFSAKIFQRGRVVMFTPGHAAHLGPKDYHGECQWYSGGYILGQDFPGGRANQLAFVMGLAQMHDMARADGY